MIGINNNNLLQKRRIAVVDEGDLVVMHLGNVEVKLPYETALQLSAWLRVHAKKAKARAGDTQRHWSIIGALTDADRR